MKHKCKVVHAVEARPCGGDMECVAGNIHECTRCGERKIIKAFNPLRHAFEQAGIPLPRQF
jgi:hypothetical protein